jgi:hypothetical protein
MKAVGLDSWPSFVADAQARARDPATVAAIEKSLQPPDLKKDAITPVYPVETALAAGAAAVTGGAAGLVGLRRAPLAVRSRARSWGTIRLHPASASAIACHGASDGPRTAAEDAIRAVLAGSIAAARHAEGYGARQNGPACVWPARARRALSRPDSSSIG